MFESFTIEITSSDIEKILKEAALQKLGNLAEGKDIKVTFTTSAEYDMRGEHSGTKFSGAKLTFSDPKGGPPRFG